MLQPFDDILSAVLVSLVVDFLEILRQQLVDQSGMRIQITLQQIKFQTLNLLRKRSGFHIRELLDPHAGLRAAVRRQNEQFTGVAATGSKHHTFR